MSEKDTNMLDLLQNEFGISVPDVNSFQEVEEEEEEIDNIDKVEGHEEEKQAILEMVEGDDKKDEKEDIEEKEEQKDEKEQGEKPEDKKTDKKEEQEEESLKLDKLEELGYLTEEELEELKGKDITEVLDYIIDKGIKDVINELPPEVRELNKHVLNGGKIEDFFKKQEIEKLDPDNIESDDQAAKLIERYMQEKGLDTDEIQEQIDLLKEGGKLQDYAKKIAPKYKAILEKREEEQKKLLEEQKKREKQMIENNKQVLREFLSDYKHDIVPITPEDKKTLPDYIFTPKVKVGGNKVSEFQKDLYMTLQDPKKYVVLAKLLRNDLSFSDIERVIEDKIAKHVSNPDSKSRKKPKKRSPYDFF